LQAAFYAFKNEMQSTYLPVSAFWEIFSPDIYPVLFCRPYFLLTEPDPLCRAKLIFIHCFFIRSSIHWRRGLILLIGRTSTIGGELSQI